MIVPKISQLLFMHKELDVIPFQELLKKTKKEKWKRPPSIVSIHGFGVHTITSKARNGGERYWFECPSCKRRCFILYYLKSAKKLGCRKCLKLQYLSSSKDNIWSRFFSYSRKSSSEKM